MKLLSDEYRQEFYSKNTERHRQSQPPEEAFLYFRVNKDIIEYNKKSKKKIERRIFEGGVEFNEFEIRNRFNK
jgi:hypothetical protein